MQSSSTISFSVVDRRTGTPATGMGVVLKCLSPTPDSFLGRVDTGGDILVWHGMGKPNSNSTLASFLSSNIQQIKRWTAEFMTTTFFEPTKPAYDSATGRVHLNFSVQPEEQIHIVLLVDIYGFSTHIQVTKLDASIPEPRPYTLLSSSQNKALMDHCIDEPYPSHSSYLKLSQRMDIPREQTVKWFQRARARNRQSRPMYPVKPDTFTAHPLKHKQTSSSELRSPYLLRSRTKKVSWAQSLVVEATGGRAKVVDAAGQMSGRDTIVVDQPAVMAGMTLVEENNQIVRRSTRFGGGSM